MSNIVLKKDFVDGDKLFAVDLNNNFRVIEAGINANDAQLQDIVDDAVERLDSELQSILDEHIWTWNSGEAVSFYKGSTSQLNNVSIKNGQILYNTSTGETALDTGNERITTGSGNVVAITNTQPTNPATKLWINPDEVISSLGTEVVDSMEGTQTHRAPSVHAVKEYIDGNLAEITGEMEIASAASLSIVSTAFSYAGSIILPYPEGFTQSNCYAIANEVETPNEGVIENMPIIYYDNEGEIEGKIEFDSRIDGIHVSYIGNMWDSDDTLSITVLLMKVN